MVHTLFGIVKKRAYFTPEQPSDTDMLVPSDLFFRCPKCAAIMVAEDFVKNAKVCTCGHHARLGAWERLEQTTDPGSFVEMDANMVSKNPLHFEGYTKKTEHLRAATGVKDGIVTGRCTIGGIPCIIGVMDSNFMMASMGSVVGEKITRAFETATAEGLPVVLFTASGGARMQEGILSLMQMAKTSGAVGLHSRAGLLYLTVLTDPTTGGVTASFASLGDIILAEPGATVGFAGRRVIEATIKEKLPKDFQTAEFLLEKGFVDLLVERVNMREALAQLMRLHTKKEAE